MRSEVIQSSFYDTGECDRLSFILFDTPIGFGGKTIFETNMVLSRKLQENHKFLFETLNVSAPIPVALGFFLNQKCYGSFKLWGENSIKMLPISINYNDSFYWRVDCNCSSFSKSHGNVIVTMIGVLYRPI